MRHTHHSHVPSPLPVAVVVSGAASGIGRATALRLARDGIAIGCLDIDGHGAEATRTMIVATGGLAASAGVDVADADAVVAAVERFDRELGPVGGVVHAAGIGGRGRFLEVTDAGWRRMLDVHLMGAVHLIRAALPGMTARNHGRIVLVASEAVLNGHATVHYTAAKAALVGLVRSLARDVASQGVRVNAVAPGPVDTPMLWMDGPEPVAQELATVPIGRLLAPEEIAESIAFLVGPGGDAYVGQVLSPSGGTALT